MQLSFGTACVTSIQSRHLLIASAATNFPCVTPPDFPHPCILFCIFGNSSLTSWYLLAILASRASVCLFHPTAIEYHYTFWLGWLDARATSFVTSARRQLSTSIHSPRRKFNSEFVQHKDRPRHQQLSTWPLQSEISNRLKLLRSRPKARRPCLARDLEVLPQDFHTRLSILPDIDDYHGLTR